MKTLISLFTGFLTFLILLASSFDPILHLLLKPIPLYRYRYFDFYNYGYQFLIFIVIVFVSILIGHGLGKLFNLVYYKSLKQN